MGDSSSDECYSQGRKYGDYQIKKKGGGSSLTDFLRKKSLNISPKVVQTQACHT